MSKECYKDAVRSLNRIAWVNGKKARFTEDELRQVEILRDNKNKRKFNTLHLFMTKRLALYSVTQVS